MQSQNTTVQEPVTDWQEFEGFTRYFPEVENYRHRANGYLADMQARHERIDNFPIPLAVLFTSQARLNAVPSL